MSLAPLVAPGIRGVHGKKPEVGAWCPIPGCISRSQQGHHLWPRSALRGQPQDWVKLPSGATSVNVVGVCRRHHDLITENKGWIKLEHGDLYTYWEQDTGTWQPMGLLVKQPLVIGREAPEIATARAHVDLKPGETCGSCGYTRPRKGKALPRRKTQTWGVVVPDDAEIGADVLDDWVAQFAALLGFDHTQRLARYHVISVVLAWAMQHRDVLISDLAESRSA